jgi:hypothetical protein
MLKKILPILLALTVLLSACAPQGTPTMAPADVQGTAVSAAWTIVALTQLAIPTATPLPPTETPSPTPLPTFTAEPLIIPTLEPLIQPTATSAPSDPNNCSKPLDVGAAGPTTDMRIENASGGVISVISLYLNPNTFGQCGFLSYNNIAINGRQKISLPRGNWWASANIAYKNGQSGFAQGGFTIRNSDYDLLRIIVGPDTIGAKP